MPRVCGTCGRAVGDAAYCPFCSQPTIERFSAQLSQGSLVTRSDALTIRKLLERKKRRINIVLFGSFLFFMAEVLSANTWKESPACFLVPFAAFAITIIYARSFAFCCPRCANIGDLSAFGHNPWRIDKRIRHRPFCGVDIDVEIDPETHKPIELLNKEWGQPELESESTDIQLPPGKQRANTDIQLPPGKEEKGTT